MKKSLVWVLVVPFSLLACGGESSSDDSTGGTPGSGGSATGGSATGGSSTGGSGTGAASGGGGTTAGTGGGGVGGAVGGSGGGTTSPSGTVGECKSDEDCELATSCCDCVAAKKGTATTPPCDAVACKTDQCTALGVTQARCIAGQCTIGLDCDGSKVTCEMVQPTCPQGQVPMVQGSCWGPCVSALSCAAVDSCFVCPTGSACIGFDAWTSDYHCVNPAPGCSSGCACMGPLACTNGYDACSDGIKDGSAVHCSCPSC